MREMGRFLLLTVMWGCALAFLARVMLASDMPWTGPLVWAAALLLATVDAAFRRGGARKR